MTAEQESSPDSNETSPNNKPGKASAGEKSDHAGGSSDMGRLARRCVANWRPILATALVIATIGVAAGLYYFQYRPAQQFNDATTRQVVQAASDGAVAVVSYSYDNLDHDIARAKSLSAGDFLAYYSKFSQDFIKPAAEKGHLTATAKILRAGVSEFHPDSAVVLVFMNQTTASKEKPEPLTTTSSVLVTLTKVDGTWLITKLDPL